MKDPNIALKVIETEPIVNDSSPYSPSLETPIPCEALPMEIPRLIALSIRQTLKIVGPRIAPTKPAIITKTAVKVGIPPIVSLIGIATGEVMDFGNNDNRICSSNDNNLDNIIILIIPEKRALNTLKIIGNLYL